MDSYIQTVTGPVLPDSIGFTLPHEHTYIELWHIWDRHDYHQMIPDEQLLVDELGEFTRRGGTCLVDLTLPGIGRRPEALRRLSTLADLAIVMGCGWYRQPYYPAAAAIDERSVEDITEELLGEIENGVGQTGVKPGIIGEIGTHKSWVTAQEERVCRAAGRASKTSGLSITTHSARSEVGLDQLTIFEQEGADPSRVIIGHADSHPFLDFYLRVMERGANIAFDSLGEVPVDHYEPRIMKLLLELLERGYADRIFLSQDTCHTRHLKAFQGNGYSYIAETFLPRLRAAGVDEEAIEQMTVHNPRRILSIAK